jgi:hypothetical protein
VKGLKIAAISVVVVFLLYEVAIALLPEWMIVGFHVRWPWK